MYVRNIYIIFAQTTLQPRLSWMRYENVSLWFGERDGFLLRAELSQ